MPISGESLDRPTYSFLHTLTEGNSAICRLYWHEIFKVYVVQKTVSMLGVPDGLGNEPALLKEVEHEQIVRVWDAQWDGDPALEALHCITFVSPYYEGGSVYSALTEGHRFRTSKVVRISLDILSALDFLHSEKLYLHRDVKPANLMLNESRYRGFLGDLGSAARIDPITGTAPNEGGSDLYLAPEAYPTGLVTARSDLYSLGVTMVEMLNGRLPYESLDADAMRDRLEHGQRAVSDRLLELAPWVPMRLARFVRSMIDVNPDGRPESAAVARAQLLNLEIVDWMRTSGEGLEGTWIGGWPPAKRPEQQHQLEVRTSICARRKHKGQLEVQVRKRRPKGQWRTVKRHCQVVHPTSASLRAVFREVEKFIQESTS